MGHVKSFWSFVKSSDEFCQKKCKLLQTSIKKSKNQKNQIFSNIKGQNSSKWYPWHYSSLNRLRYRKKISRFFWTTLEFLPHRKNITLAHLLTYGISDIIAKICVFCFLLSHCMFSLQAILHTGETRREGGIQILAIISETPEVIRKWF